MTDKALLEQKSLVDSFLNQGPRPLSSFSFMSIFAWCDFFDFELKMINDSLCVFAKGEAGCFLYLPPLGRLLDPSTVSTAFAHMTQAGKPKAVNRVENIPGNLLSAFGLSRYNHYTKSAEYVYRKQDLIDLKGNAYKSQRHDCNVFAAHHPKHTFEPYEDTDFEPCLKLYKGWAKKRAQAHGDEIYRAMLQENQKVHGRLLKYWKDLGLEVRVLKSEGKAIGYTFGFGIDENTFCIYAEIADLTIAGAAAYMFKSFCSDEQLKNFSRINAMDDFGLPNVARAKQAYHPSELIASYSVSLK